MPITETIATRQQSAASPFGNTRPVKTGKGPEGIRDKDLFQKYILDKESEAAAKDSESTTGQTVGHDSELQAQQGMIAARNHSPQQPEATLPKAMKDGNQPQGKQAKGGGVAKEARESEPRKQAFPPTKSQSGKQPGNPSPKQSASQAKPPAHSLKVPLPGAQNTSIGPGKISSQPQIPAPASTTESRKASRSVQPSNQEPKSGPNSQNGAEVVAKTLDKAGRSGTGQNQTGSDGQQQHNAPGQESFSQLLETIPQQQPAQGPSESPSFQQAAAQTGANGQSSGMQSVYSGAVAQVAQQILRMQENGGTSRVTLDMPDGEKLLVRFNVRPGNGGVKVQFATKSRQLREALEKSWESLRVDAAKRGVELDIPEFESMDGEVPSHQLSGETAGSLLK